MIRAVWRFAALASGLLILTSAGLAAYFLWSSTSDNGAACTFDNLGCASNRDLSTGLRWLALSGAVGLGLGLTWLIRERTRRRLNRESQR